MTMTMIAFWFHTYGNCGIERERRLIAWTSLRTCMKRALWACEWSEIHLCIWTQCARVGPRSETLPQLIGWCSREFFFSQTEKCRVGVIVIAFLTSDSTDWYFSCLFIWYSIIVSSYLSLPFLLCFVRANYRTWRSPIDRRSNSWDGWVCCS